MPHFRRLFIGLALPEAVAQPLHAAVRGCLAARDAAHLRFSRAADLHLTLLFLGNVGEEMIPALEAGLERAARNLPAIELEIAAMGGFPSNARPRTLWAGVEASGPRAGGLARMRAVVVQAVREAGVGVSAPDADGPFRPHLTLARSRSTIESRALESFFALEFRAGWRAQEIVLFQSGAAQGEDRPPAGASPAPRYRALGSFPLAGGA